MQMYYLYSYEVKHTVGSNHFVVLFIFMQVSRLGITLHYETPVKHVFFFFPRGIFKSPPMQSPCHAAVALLGAGQKSCWESGAAAAGEIYGQAVTQVNVEAAAVHHF